MTTEIVKAGWLHRQSKFLQRWKRNWFTLDKQGDLRYFESQNDPRAEERIVIRACVLQVLAGQDCSKHDPPSGISRTTAGFLELKFRDRDKMVLCAESLDDMKAWQISLEQARTFATPAPPPGTFVAPPGVVSYGVPGYVGYGAPVIASPYYSSGLGLGWGGYPGQVISTVPTQQVYHTPAGNTTVIAVPQVIMDDDPWRYRGRYGCRYNHRRGRFHDW